MCHLQLSLFLAQETLRREVEAAMEVVAAVEVVVAGGLPTLRSLEVFLSFPICLLTYTHFSRMEGLRIALYDAASANTPVSQPSGEAAAA